MSNYSVIIKTVKSLDYTQSPIEQRKITLKNDDETIFENESVFVAHRRMYMMGLAQLAKQNCI